MHTPGPWMTKRATVPTDGAYDYAIYDSGQHLIAEAFGRTSVSNWPNAEANARLIAAAPELFEALKELIAECPCDWDITEKFQAAYGKSKAALAKAEGQPAVSGSGKE